MPFREGETEGQMSVRFCHYSHSGRFQRSPLIMSMDEVDEMRADLKETPELLAVLRHLVSE